MIACAALVLGLVTMGSWRTSAGLIVGTIVFAAGQSLAFPAIALLAMARVGEAERSAVIGSVTGFVDVALAAGAFSLGAVAALTDYAGAFLAASAVAAAGLGLLLRLRPVPAPEPAG